MKFLLLDVGNSMTKWTLADENNKIRVMTFTSVEQNILYFLSRKEIHDADVKIFSNVKKLSPQVQKVLRSLNFVSLKFLAKSYLRFNYAWEELGEDRIAATLGAYYTSNFHTPLLIIQMGTAITYDYMLKPLELEGGAISPGLFMRFRALHNFTDLLPLIEPETFEQMTGHSTREAILSGVLQGVKAELIFRIEDFLSIYSQGKVFLTGGDINYFAISNKNQIFAEPDLVLLGLYYAATTWKPV